MEGSSRWSIFIFVCSRMSSIPFVPSSDSDHEQNREAGDRASPDVQALADAAAAIRHTCGAPCSAAWRQSKALAII